MDTVQVLLIAAVIVLTIMLVAFGLQVFYILRELRKTIHKLNRVLDNTESITESVSAPISSFSAMLTGMKGGATIAGFLKKLREKKGLPSGRASPEAMPAERQGKS